MVQGLKIPSIWISEFMHRVALFGSPLSGIILACSSSCGYPRLCPLNISGQKSDRFSIRVLVTPYNAIASSFQPEAIRTENSPCASLFFQVSTPFQILPDFSHSAEASSHCFFVFFPEFIVIICRITSLSGAHSTRSEMEPATIF